MKPVWRAISLAAGVAGATLLGTAVGIAARRSLRAQRRHPIAEEPPAREFTVSADDGVPLSVEEIAPTDGGSPDLTVVLVHGYTLDRRSWIFQRESLPRLADPRVRLVRYDQRGHGRSGRSTRAHSTLDQLGRDLDAVLRVVAPDEPVVLVGHSMGGMTIMALAEHRPELFGDPSRGTAGTLPRAPARATSLEAQARNQPRTIGAAPVLGVALVGTSAGEIGRRGLPRPVLSRYNPFTLGLAKLTGWQPGLVERAHRMTGHLTWGAVRALSFGDRKIDPERVDLVHQMIEGTSVQAISDFLATLATHHRYRALAALRRCEVLVIGGDADQITTFSHSEAIAAELPDSQLVRVPGAGHMVAMERPELVDGYLAAFLTRCAAANRQPREWRADDDTGSTERGA
ncbi:alpha/beta hydrolase [Longimycelium tulufanense]|uniref:Alpha/beta hydrolase n=1 Tax=Longimycelium tulufanense TaxID=907463 RepID=A0A8J3CFL8_9PSEU|nr:alpha/beta hydrolase [Longimycelium tulufanense]GGM58376.1 alpha/beta hydrolase [Longimycelium tulufanense]